MPIPASPTILLAVASVALLCGRSLPVRLNWIPSYGFLIAGLLAAYFLVREPVVTWDAAGALPLSTWNNDGFALSEQWIVLAFGVLFGFSILDSPLHRSDSSRLGGFLLFAVAGMMLVAASNDFLTLGLSLEIVNLAIMALSRQRDPRPDNRPRAAGRNKPTGETLPIEKLDREVDTNHCLPSGDSPNKPPVAAFYANPWFHWLPSAWMWLGIALLSNATATTNFDRIRLILIEAYDPGDHQTAIGAPSKLILLASGLIAMGLFAQMALVPFHLGQFATLRRQSNWTSLFVQMASQFTGAIALTRLFGYLFVGLSQALLVLTIVVTLATFALCAVMGLRGLSPGTQSMRDLVCSLILLQAGWLAVGPMIVAIELDHSALRWGAFPHQPESVAIVLFGQVASLLAGCGAYSALSYLARTDRRIEFLEDVKGLARYSPVTSIALLAPLASVCAVPWTAGFWARWMLMLAGHNVHVKSTSSILTPHYGIRMSILAGVLATVAFVAPVLRLAREMFLESPLAKQAPTGGRGPLAVSLITATASLLIGVSPHLVIGPLKFIQSPRTVSPHDPERGSGRNSLGFKASSREPVFLTSQARQ